jgi:hypothetical protein
MNFKIRASRDGESTEAAGAGPALTVAKARMLSKAGWAVEIIDADGVSYAPPEFDQLLSFDRPRSSQLTPRRNVLDVVTDILKKPVE